MNDGDWFRTIDQAVALGAEEIQLIGGGRSPRMAAARRPHADSLGRQMQEPIACSLS